MKPIPSEDILKAAHAVVVAGYGNPIVLDIADAIADERERCAKIALDVQGKAARDCDEDEDDDYSCGRYRAAMEIVTAIRDGECVPSGSSEPGTVNGSGT